MDDYSKMPFGKYKGEKMGSIPGKYLLWLLDNATNLKPDLHEYLTLKREVFELEVKFAEEDKKKKDGE